MIFLDKTIIHVTHCSDEGILDSIDFSGITGYWLLKSKHNVKHFGYDGGCGECSSEYNE